MKKQISISLILLSSILTMNAQTLYLPNGIAGIGNNATNSNVGIGTTVPKTKTEFNSGLPTSLPTYTDKTNGIAVTDGGLIYGRIGVANLASGGNGYPTYFQAGDWSGAIYYNLLLNPIGGKVGIGTNSPEAKLHVSGTIISGVKDYSFNAAVFQLTNQSNVDGISGVSPTGAFRWYTNPNRSFRDGFLYQLRSYDSTNGESSGLITITGSGNTGIGTTTPGYKLDVCGTIRAKEIKVDLLGGCDFVFKKDYKLMSLNNLEKFVTTKQHLPEIASEKEMIENGLNMKEFQMKLLQKVEELTLYVIEQNKQIKKQNVEIRKLKEIKKRN